MKFEENMKRLEEIVGILDRGEATLDDSLKLFEEGMKISGACSKKLEEMEKKIEKLKKTEDGKIETEPFLFPPGEERPER